MSTPDAPQSPPALRIVRGEVTAEELAALVTVLAAASGGGEPTGPAGGPVAQWAPPARLVRPGMAPTGWWESSLPR